MINKKILEASFEELEKVAGGIANIERYAINDGNGVRTTVFFKGCYLRCKWCSNPETQIFTPEMSFFSDKCIGCQNCVRLCKYHALDKGLIADRNICATCYERDEPFVCTKQCYPKCRIITGKSYTVGTIYDQVKKDYAFYKSSGGGVTLSGGEPMAQPNLAYALLKTLTNKWIDTAIETCGFAEKEDYEYTIPYINTVFIDIKNMDSRQHKIWTGQGNEKILSNILRISELTKEYGQKLFIRVPIIPGFNDSNKNIEETVDFVTKLDNVTGMELLPYHKLGRGKYYSLGRKYFMEDTVSPSDARMQELNEIIAKHNIPIYKF